MICYNDGTTLHGTNLERPRTDVSLAANLAALNAESVLDLNGEALAYIDVRSTFVGTFGVQGSVDGTNYFDLPFINQASQLWATTFTAGGAFAVNCAGLKKIRVRNTAYTSGTAVVTLRASIAPNIIFALPMPATLSVTNTGVSGAAVTLTLSAPGAGLFHYITRIILQRHTSALLTAGSTPLLCTTTNLPGSRVFSVPADAAAQGVVHQEIVEPSQPLKSSTANTATTIVCPATTGVIWRVTADYYSAA